MKYKLSMIWLLSIFVLVLPAPGSPYSMQNPSETNQTHGSSWFQGYQQSHHGGTIQYHSPHPDVDSALLVRSLDSRDFIEWSTQPVPREFSSGSAHFVWIFGMDVDLHPHSYDLYVNREKWLTFSNPESTELREWTIRGPDGAVLNFRVTMIDRHGDVFGYASLEVPSSRLKAGEPLNLKIVGESSGSRVWYMTFQSPVRKDMTFVQFPALKRKNEGVFQPVEARIVHLGDPAEIRISGDRIPPVEGRLQFGHNRFQLEFPVISRNTEFKLAVKTGNDPPVTKGVTLEPVRDWTLYLVQHTHTDIGYTRPQTEILPEHLRYIDYALDYCDLTDEYPENSKFRWTCEASWAVEEYLKSRPKQQIDRLVQRVKEGRIEITGMLYNLSEIMDENLALHSLDPFRSFRKHVLQVTTAMQNDVNGIAWCFADYFQSLGVRYLNMGQHGHRARVPFDKPTAFWWESPSGKRILAYRPDHYMTGNMWGIHTGNFNGLETELFKYLSSLESREYPYQRVAVQYSGVYTDNSPPSPAICDVIRKWNQTYARPVLRNASVREFFQYIEDQHGDKLKTYRKAWPDWWSDGFGSSARETAAARRSQAELLSVQGLLSMARIMCLEVLPDSFQKLEKIASALLFWTEHTMGAAESISDPLSENSRVQWAEKAAYVWEAVKDLGLLKEAAMGQIQTVVPRGRSAVVAVFNTLNWARSGLFRVFIDHELMPQSGTHRLVDESGREAPMQYDTGRAEGSYWHIWAEEVPPMGYKTYRVVPREKTPSPDPMNSSPAELENEFFRIVLDPERGGLSSIFDKQTGQELTDRSAPYLFGEFIHETLTNRAQLEQFRLNAFERSGLTTIQVESGDSGPIWRSLRFTAHTEASAPNTVLRGEIRLYHTVKQIEIRFSMVMRDFTDPEGIYIAFPVNSPNGEILFETIGGEINPEINQLEGTSTDWNAVQNYARIRDGRGQFVLVSDEIPLVQLGGLNLGKFLYRPKIESPHIYSWVLNNYWVTNFKAGQPGEFRWGYLLTRFEDPSTKTAVRFGWGARVPLLARVFPPAEPDDRPWSFTSFKIPNENLLLIGSRPLRKSGGVLLHIREIAGRQTEFSIQMKFGNEWRKVPFTETDILGDVKGERKDTAVMGPYETKTFLLFSPEDIS